MKQIRVSLGLEQLGADSRPALTGHLDEENETEAPQSKSTLISPIYTGHFRNAKVWIKVCNAHYELVSLYLR